MPAFELVIFDNDAVLVDSERVANRVLADLLTEHGWPRTIEQVVRDFMGGPLALVREAFARATFRNLPPAFDMAFNQRLFSLFHAGLEATDGVKALLDQLDAGGITYCVAASGGHDRIQVALESTGLGRRFSGRVFSSEDVEQDKPAPDLFLHAASSLGVDPVLCAVVEDSAEGVVAAKAAGMTVYGYAATTPPEQLAAADRVVSSMTDLLPLLLARG